MPLPPLRVPRPSSPAPAAASDGPSRYDAGIERGWLVVPRWGWPEEVARAVTTLAQGLLPYTVGQAVRVDGAMLINR